jgi:hypothetical protein
LVWIYIIDDNDGGKDEGKGVSSVMGRRELLRTKNTYRRIVKQYCMVEKRSDQDTGEGGAREY